MFRSNRVLAHALFRRTWLTGLAGFAFLVVRAPGAGPSGVSAPGTAPAPSSGGLFQMDMRELSNVPLGNVYGASKTKEKSRQAPSTVSVITAEDIRRYGYRNLADILRSVRGFSVTDDRTYSYIGVRGFGRPSSYNSRILILVDGHRLNDPIYGAVYAANEGLVDVDLIDRVEIVRGPSSSLYGTGAFFGVVNIITREPLGQHPSEVSAATGGFDAVQARATAAHATTEHSSFLLSTTSFERQGEKSILFPEFAGVNGGLALDRDEEDAERQFGKFRMGEFRLELAHVRRRKYSPTASYETIFNDPEFVNTDTLGYVDLTWDHTFESGWNVLARAYHNEQAYEGILPYDVAAPGDPPERVLSRDLGFGRWWGGELTMTRQLSPTSRLVIGSEYQNNARQDQINFDEEPFLLNLFELHSSSFFSVYGQYQTELTPGLSLNAGVRKDWFDPGDSTINPRLALVGTARDSTVIKLLYGTAFRLPNHYELFYQDNGKSQLPSPDLRPEEIATYEVAWEERHSEVLSSIVSYYYYQMQNLVDAVIDPATGFQVFVNSNTLDARGLELELAGRWPGGVQARASYARQEARDRVTGAELTNSPRDLAKLNVSFPLDTRGDRLSLESQLVGERCTRAGGSVPGYAVTNLTLYLPDVWCETDVSLSGYNVLDRRYRDPGGVQHLQDSLPQYGRDYRLKITRRF